MSPLSRRRAIRAGSALCSASVAGCLDLYRSDDREAELSNVTLRNSTPDEQSVLIVVEEAGEHVYGEFTAVPPADGDVPVTRDVPDLPEGPGVYDVYFNLARRPEDVEGEFWARADNTDADCREYLVDVRSDDTGKPLLGIYRSNGC